MQGSRAIPYHHALEPPAAHDWAKCAWRSGPALQIDSDPAPSTTLSSLFRTWPDRRQRRTRAVLVPVTLVHCQKWNCNLVSAHQSARSGPSRSALQCWRCQDRAWLVALHGQAAKVIQVADVVR